MSRSYLRDLSDTLSELRPINSPALASITVQAVSSNIGVKPPHIMRLPSKGMSMSCQRGSVCMLAPHLSCVSLSGQIIH